MTEKQRAVEALRQKRDFVKRLAIYDDVALYELCRVGKIPNREDRWVYEKDFQFLVGIKLSLGTQASAYTLLHPKPSDRLDFDEKLQRGIILAGRAIQRSLKASGVIETRRNNGSIEIRAIDPELKRPNRTPGLESFYLDQIQAERRSEQARKNAATRRKNREERLEEAERLKALSVLDQLAAEREVEMARITS